MLLTQRFVGGSAGLESWAGCCDAVGLDDAMNREAIGCVDLTLLVCLPDEWLRLASAAKRDLNNPGN